MKKKNKVEHKQKHYELIQESLDKHNNMFILKPHNMRNSQLKQLRDRFISSEYVPLLSVLSFLLPTPSPMSDLTFLSSSLFIGKNRTMARALGSDTASEYKNNTHKMSKVRLYFLLFPSPALLFNLFPISPPSFLLTFH